MRSYQDYCAGYDNLPAILKKQLEAMTGDGRGAFAVGALLFHIGVLGFSDGQGAAKEIEKHFDAGGAKPFLEAVEVFTATFGEWESCLFWDFFRVYLDSFQAWEIACTTFGEVCRLEENSAYYNVIR